MATSLKAQTRESSGKGRLDRTLKRKGRPVIQEDSPDYGKVHVTGMRETAFSPALPSNRHFKLRVTKGGRKTQRKDARLGLRNVSLHLLTDLRCLVREGNVGRRLRTPDGGDHSGPLHIGLEQRRARL